MKGAHTLLTAAADAGVEVIFANPGTTELGLLAALDDGSNLRPVLGLSEAVVAGAADGYGRMTDLPALTLMHLGPSFGNAISNLHNARRAGSPVVNLVGDHPAHHRALDPLLSCDTRALAATVSGWVGEVTSPANIRRDVIAACAAARRYPGQVATLIVPSDCLDGEATTSARSVPALTDPPRVSFDGVDRVRDLIARSSRTMLLLGGRALRSDALRSAARIAERSGCELYCETFPARLEVGPDLPRLSRLPYVPATCRALLSIFDLVVAVGTRLPIAFFCGAEERPELLPETVRGEVLVAAGEDAAEALEALADVIDVGKGEPITEPKRLATDLSRFTGRTMIEALAAGMPDRAIAIDEGVSLGGMLLTAAIGRRPFSYLSLTGGTTGFGLACAVGSAVACVDRRVVALVGDGSALYAPQALWTQVRESLAITNVIVGNGGYQILQRELLRTAGRVGEQSRHLTEIDSPAIDWCQLASGFGMPAVRVASREAFSAELERCNREQGPSLIEVQLG